MSFFPFNLKERIKHFINTLTKIIWSRKSYLFIIKQWTQLEDLHSCSEVLQTMRFTNHLEPVELTSIHAKKILVIAPHPDDEMLGAGGTLIKAIKQGIHVKVVYITSGKENQHLILEKETVAISEKIGYTTHFLKYSVGAIPDTEEPARQMAKVIADYQPDICFISALFDDHPEHRLVNKLLLIAYKNQWLPKQMMMWGYQVYSTILPNVVIDITAEKDLKAEAINLWETQKSSRDFAHYILGLNAFNVRFLKTNQKRYAETFFVLPLEEYVKLCSLYYSNLKNINPLKITQNERVTL